MDCKKEWKKAAILIIGFLACFYIPVGNQRFDNAVMESIHLVKWYAQEHVFGVALGPCTFAYMAPMLGVTFKLASTNLPYGILLLFVYGIGHCSVIVFAGTFTEVVQRYMNWNEKSKGSAILKKVCGVLVLPGSIYLVYTAHLRIITSIRRLSHG